MADAPLPSHRSRTQTQASLDLYRRCVQDHHAAVYRCAWRITRNAADAQDVTQQLFVSLFERPDLLESVQDMERVLRWRTVKLALMQLRSERNRRRREEEHAVRHPEAQPPPPPESTEAVAALRRCVSELPDELRLATVLRFQEGLTFAEVAEGLGVAEPTAFDRVKRALEKLRVRLVQMGHAGALVEVERWLALDETVAVPAGLASGLLALAPATASAGALAFLPTAAILLLVAGGGLLVLRGPRVQEPTTATTSVTSAANGASSTPEDPALVAARTPQAPQTPPTHGTTTNATHGSTAGDFLWSELPFPPTDEADRPVATGLLRGAVVDDEGAPVRGAKVVATSYENTPKGWQWRSEGASDAAGSFALTVAVAVAGSQDYFVAIDHPDCLPWKSERVAVAADTPADLGRIGIPRNRADAAGEYTLALTVRAPDGRPVSGVGVRLFRKLEAKPANAASETTPSTPATLAFETGGVTDEGGVVRVAGSRIGAKILEVDGRHCGFRAVRRELAVRFTGFQEESITVEPALTISGRLVAPANERFAESFEVRAVPTGTAPDDAVDAWYSTTANADGSFQVGGLDPGRYSLEVRSRFAPALQDDIEAGATDVLVQLKALDDPRDVGAHMAEIHGRIVDAGTGAPVAVNWDAIECALVEPVGEVELRADVLPALASPRMGQTSVEGNFVPPPPSAEFHQGGLEAGDYVVVVRAAGYAPGLSRCIHLERRQLATEVVIALAQACAVSGTVRDPEGRPLANAIVFTTGQGPRSTRLVQTVDEQVRKRASEEQLWIARHVRTGADGQFMLGGLPPEALCCIAVLHPDFEPRLSGPVALRPGETTGGIELRCALRR